MNTAISSLRSIFFLLCIVIAGQAHGNSGTILIMGDSLSAAYGVETGQAWVALLRNRLERESLSGWEVANASISGETTDGGLRRLPKMLERHQPDIVILELGGNDGLRGFPPKVIRSNLSTMIEQSRTAGARVLLVGMQMPPNYGPRYAEAFASIFPELAEEKSAALVPFFLKDIYNRDKMMQDDGIHPTRAAQPILLDNLWPELEPLIRN